MIIYTTSWCGFCHRLKRQLERDGVAFREVDIERDPAAASLVMSLNQGNATVPTVVFADGSSATNPTAAEVRSRIAAA
jgi:mycoredoxin